MRDVGKGEVRTEWNKERRMRNKGGNGKNRGEEGKDEAKGWTTEGRTGEGKRGKTERKEENEEGIFVR